MRAMLEDLSDVEVATWETSAPILFDDREPPTLDEYTAAFDELQRREQPPPSPAPTISIAGWTYKPPVYEPPPPFKPPVYVPPSLPPAVQTGVRLSSGEEEAYLLAFHLITKQKQAVPILSSGEQVEETVTSVWRLNELYRLGWRYHPTGLEAGA